MMIRGFTAALVRHAPVAVFAAATVLAGLVWWPNIRDLMPTADQNDRRQTVPTTRVGSTLALESRPLFHVSRRSSRPTAPVAEAEAPKTFEQRHALRGLAEMDEGAIGIIELVGMDQSVRMKPGQMLAGHRLVALDSQSARFETADGRVVTVTRRSPP